MPAITFPSISAASAWGDPIPNQPWVLPAIGARGNGLISLVDNMQMSRVNRLERLTLTLHVHCAPSDWPEDDRVISIPFPARRTECRAWMVYRPLNLDLAQLQFGHEESFDALHSMFAYFGARHPPWDNDSIQIQWHGFARAVWEVIEDPDIAQDARVAAIAHWGRRNLPDELFEWPWWQGRWEWCPPCPRDIQYLDDDNGSELGFGEGLDGLPVPEGTFPPPDYASWAQDAVGPVQRVSWPSGQQQ